MVMRVVGRERKEREEIWYGRDEKETKVSTRCGERGGL